MKIFNDLLVDVSISTVQQYKFYNDYFVRKKHIEFNDYFTFKREQISIFDFVHKITQGYVFCPIFNGGDNYFDKNVRTDDNFAFTNFVVVDILHFPLDLNTFISKIPLKPTIAYGYTFTGESFVEGKEHCFKLIYFFDKKITSVAEYRRIRAKIISMLNSNHDVKVKYDLEEKVSDIFEGMKHGTYHPFDSLPTILLFNSLEYSVNDFDNYKSSDEDKEDGIDEMFSFEKKQQEDRDALAAKIFEQFKKSE